jgi:hypothetical protein
VPETGLPFCTEYRDTACCDAKDTLSIRGSVLQLMRPECSNCYRMVSEWKCAECHPNAGLYWNYKRTYVDLKECFMKAIALPL